MQPDAYVLIVGLPRPGSTLLRTLLKLKTFGNEP